MFAIPVVLAAAVTQHDAQGGKRADQQDQRNPDAVRDQDRRHRDQGDAVLQQAAVTLQQRNRPIARVRLGPVQLIEVLRPLVERHVQAAALLVDQVPDVVGQQIRLDGAHAAADEPQRLLGQQNSGQGHQRPPETNAGDACFHHGGQVIDRQPHQVHRGDRQQALDDDQRQGRQRPASGRVPDQQQRARRIPQFRQEPAQLRRDCGGCFWHRTLRSNASQKRRITLARASARRAGPGTSIP